MLWTPSFLSKLIIRVESRGQIGERPESELH